MSIHGVSWHRLKLIIDIQYMKAGDIMKAIDINFVTALIYMIVLLYVLKGIRYRFSSEEMTAHIISRINFILMLTSFIFSSYIVYLAFLNTDNPVHSFIYKTIPKAILLYIDEAGIIFYAITLIILSALIYNLLVRIRRLIDFIIVTCTSYLGRHASKWSSPHRAAVGIMLKMPGMIVSVLVTVLLLGALNAYYPYGRLNKEVQSSRPYNYINSYVVIPAVQSNFCRDISTFIWSSAAEISSQMSSTEVLNKQYSLDDLSLLRFKIEAKSNEEIDSEARKIVGSEKNEYKKAYLLYGWIRDNISYDWGKYNDILNNRSLKDRFGAINTFETRKGICEDYSDLYAAMARAAGLKVRIIVGQGFDGSGWTGHAWNEVYITSIGKWIPLDTTWAQAGNYFNNKGFYKTHVQQSIAAEW